MLVVEEHRSVAGVERGQVHLLAVQVARGGHAGQRVELVLPVERRDGLGII